MNYLFIGIIAFLFLTVFFMLLIMVLRANHDLRNHEIMEAELRFENLQAKMNPHFLFNMLDGLVSLVELSHKDKALEMIRALSYILHVDLRETRYVIPLIEELRYVRKYVFLQEIRYKGQFRFSIEIDDSVPEELRIMRYCIQPLVENSFVHGVYLRTQFITISARIWREQNTMRVLVSDDGPGASIEECDRLLRVLSSGNDSGLDDGPIIPRKHLGLVSINQRIQCAYGKQYGLRVIPSEKGFRTEVSLPILLDDPADTGH